MYGYDQCGDQATTAHLLLARMLRLLYMQHTGNFVSETSIAVSSRAPPTSPKLSVVREKSGAREMDARDLQTVILKTAVPVMAMVLLLTASAVSMTPDDCACACLRTCFFRSNCFPMICVLCQINLGRLLAREAVLAPTLAGRRYYAVGAVACFVQLALKLCMILVLCPAAVEGCA